MIKSKPCIVDGCEYPRFAKGYCTSHQHLRTDKKPKFKKVKQIAKISARRKTERQIYSVKRRMFLEQHPKCAVYLDLDATEIHHKNSTRHGKLLDDSDWLAVSRKGHLWIHDNPEAAEEKGWLIKGRNSK
jgi:hypothetical protein